MKQGRKASEHPIRLVAVDLDGTLLTDTKQVSAKTVRALIDLPGRGVKLVIASARPPRSVRHIYKLLKLDTWQINYNGALIWDEPSGRAVFHRPMGCDVVTQVIAQARGMFPAICASCEILDKWYTDRIDERYLTETARMFKPDVVAPLESFCNQPITKLLLLGDSGCLSQLEALIALAYQDQVSVVRTDECLIQIMHRQVSKAVALLKVARHYGVNRKEIMAIGDAPNDVGMLRTAGVAVAMDNAHAIVKQYAHWVAPSNNDHGVHAALVKYGLTG